MQTSFHRDNSFETANEMSDVTHIHTAHSEEGLPPVKSEKPFLQKIPRSFRVKVVVITSSCQCKVVADLI